MISQWPAKWLQQSPCTQQDNPVLLRKVKINDHWSAQISSSFQSQPARSSDTRCDTSHCPEGNSIRKASREKHNHPKQLTAVDNRQHKRVQSWGIPAVRTWLVMQSVQNSFLSHHDVVLIHHMSMFHPKWPCNFPICFYWQTTGWRLRFPKFSSRCLLSVSSYSLNLSSVSVLFVSESEVDKLPKQYWLIQYFLQIPWRDQNPSLLSDLYPVCCI